MGSGSSRLGSRPSRSHRRKRRSFLSSLLMCGGSPCHATIEIEDDPSELLVNSMKHSEIEVFGLRSPTKESALPSGARTGLMSPGTDTETGASSESSIVASEESSFEDGLMSIETSNEGMSKSKELVPSHPLNSNYRSNDKASTSYEDQPFSDSVSANARSNADVVNGVCAEVIYSSSSSSQRLGVSPSIEISVQNQDSVSAPAVSESPITSQSQQDDTLGQSVPPGLGLVVSDREQDQIGGGRLHVDVVSVSSSILSPNEISTREARRNSRMLFWDSFSRRIPRRRSGSPAFVFSTNDADGLGSHDRWLLDLSGDGSRDGVGRDSGYMGSRTHTMNERRRYSRSEVWERLHGGHGRGYPRTSICPSGLHPDGTCSCDSILTAEESGTRTSFSRIVMLPEALFEILDEIHRQPVPLSFSVGSPSAPEAVVDSFPIKYHRDPDITPSADDAARCYICLSEYEESDKIRVLPCRHEFHMLCVDKWLKEIHGVCPLCRGDVREGFTDASVSDSGALA